MKKLVFVMPLMAVSLLASCGGGNPSPEPGKNPIVTFDAGEGNFLTGTKIIKLEVAPNSSLVYAIRSVSAPVVDGTKFAYFVRDNGSSINYNDKVTNDITLTAKYLNLTLENLSWVEIKNISVAGHPDTYFRVNDEKTITVNSLPHKIRIIDFNHDTNENGIPVGITFDFADAISYVSEDFNDPIKEIKMKWNYTDGTSSTSYDYRDSTLNNFLNNESDKNSVINMLPTDLTSVITPVNKKVGINELKEYGEKNYIAESFNTEKYPKLFPLSYEEIGVVTSSGVTANEGNAYQYYYNAGKDGTKYRIKKALDNKAVYYWLRSPCTVVDSQRAWVVDMDGFFNGIFICNDYGLVPAFCI